MTGLQPLDGPRLPARNGTARKLVIFLHGYGADGNDLIDIGRRWAAQLPDAAFVSPHAPQPCQGAPYGRQWFPIPPAMEPKVLSAGVAAARPGLDHFIDAELKRFGLAPGDIALVGFSQGAMMALHTGPRRPDALGGIVSFSGLLVDSDRLPSEIRSRPPVLLVHGEEDELIPAGALFAAAEGLGAAGFSAEWHLRPGMGHGIDEICLDLGAEFLARAFR